MRYRWWRGVREGEEGHTRRRTGAPFILGVDSSAALKDGRRRGERPGPMFSCAHLTRRSFHYGARRASCSSTEWSPDDNTDDNTGNAAPRFVASPSPAHPPFLAQARVARASPTALVVAPPRPVAARPVLLPPSHARNSAAPRPSRRRPWRHIERAHRDQGRRKKLASFGRR